MKFYFIFLIIGISAMANAAYPLLQGPGVDENTYHHFIEAQKLIKMTDYLKENLDFFDVKNEDVMQLNQIKETEPLKYETALKQLKDKIIKRPLTEKNQNFLCAASAEIKSKGISILVPAELLLKRLCSENVSSSTPASTSVGPLPVPTLAEITELKGSDFLLLKNGKAVTGIHNDSFKREVNQWTYINNSNAPLIFYGSIDEFLEVLKSHLDKKSQIISEGSCHHPEIKPSIISELNFQILFPDGCISKNYLDFNSTNKMIETTVVQPEKSVRWVYWGIAAAALAAFFANHELVIEY